MSKFNVGDKATLTKDLSIEAKDNYYPYKSRTNLEYAKGTVLDVRKIGTKKIQVSGVSAVNGRQKQQWVLISDLDAATGKIVPENPRPLGQPPTDEGTILPNDPGLEWLWEDIVRYGSKYGKVQEMDKLTDALSVPGRHRKFTATAVVNGLEMNSEVEARSQAEANAYLKDWIATFG